MTVYGEVVETEWLTPHMVRVLLAGAGLDEFTPVEFTDQYVNALFLPEGAPWSVPFDLDEARAGDPEHAPRGRRYTVRSWDPVERRLSIDFVVHGDTGLAGRWARDAQPGDRLQMVGPAGAYRPDPEADWHLMVGDESALPAIAASLEVVPTGRRVVVVGVVDDADHELTLDTPGDLDVRWVHRSVRADPDAVVDAVDAVDFAPGRVDVFVHGEAAEIRAVRKQLLGVRQVPKEGSSISPYWRRTCTDEEWRRVKRQWLAEVESDV